MARDPGDFNGGGNLRDRYGRRELIISAVNAALAPGDVQAAGAVYDTDGREQIIITGLTVGTGGTSKTTAIVPSGSDTTSATPGTSTSPANFALNINRTELRITNNSGTADIWVARGATAVVGQGEAARAGGPPVIIPYTYTGQVAVASSGTSVPYAYTVT